MILDVWLYHALLEYISFFHHQHHNNSLVLPVSRKFKLYFVILRLNIIFANWQVTFCVESIGKRKLEIYVFSRSR